MLATVVAMLAIAVVVSASFSAAPPDERLVTSFLADLHRAVERDDRPAVAALIQYPLVVRAGDIRIPIADAAALIQSYDVVFSPGLKMVVAEAARPAPGRTTPVYPVVIAETMVAIGGDLLRMQLVGGVLKITGIREPLTQPLLPAPAAEAGASSRAEHEPRRLTLQVGQTQIAGALTPDARDAYIVSAAKNQLIEVRINGVHGRDIVARIVGLKTREPLDARAREGVRTWTGRVPADGDYRIDVVRLAPAGEPRLPYVIVISMR